MSSDHRVLIAVMRNVLPALLTRLERLEAVAEAAKALAADYKELADSGDCGNWTCEEDVEEYGALMDALTALNAKEAPE